MSYSYPEGLDTPGYVITKLGELAQAFDTSDADEGAYPKAAGFIRDTARLIEWLQTQVISIFDMEHPPLIKQGFPTHELEDILTAETVTSLIHSLTYQDRVGAWCREAMGDKIASNKRIRNFRFLEEALELVQAAGATKAEALQLVDYTFGRPVGEIKSEVGGTLVTLMALCEAHGLHASECGEVELKSCWTNIEKIRAKQASKMGDDPLPGPTPGWYDPSAAKCVCRSDLCDNPETCRKLGCPYSPSQKKLTPASLNDPRTREQILRKVRQDHIGDVPPGLLHPNDRPLCDCEIGLCEGPPIGYRCRILS